MSEPARPNLAFHVGVVGHGQLPAAQLSSACLKAEEFLRTVRSEVLAFRSEDAAAAKAYSPVPPQMRCFSGLSLGADMSLAEAALRQDFSVAGVLAFARSEFERDFQAGPEVDGFRALLARCATVIELDGDRGREADAYEQVAEFLIEHSDLLVAIWDGQPIHGVGGAAEAVASALRAGRPVFVIPPADPASSRLLDADSADLRDIVQSRLRVVTNGEFPAAYFSEKREAAPWSAALVRTYDRILASGLPAPMTPPPRPYASSALFDDFERADRRAQAYGSLYRAAGLLRYGLVVPATVGAIVASLSYRPFQIAGNVADFLILVFLVAFSSSRLQAPIHERFVQYRGLAERLRGAVLLAPFAGVAFGNARDWTSWLAAAYAKAEGRESICFNEDAITKATNEVRAIAQEQIDFMKARAKRNRLASQRLSRIGIGLSALGICFAGLRAAFLVANVGAESLFLLNGAALVLPALGPVFLGLANFNEYSRHASRYEAIARELDRHLVDLQESKGSRAARVRIVRRIVDTLIEESSDWRTLTKLRSVSAF